MGCDIHLILERRLIKKDKPSYTTEFSAKTKKYEVVEDKSEWVNNSKEYKLRWHACDILGYDVTIGERIYGMFAKLANVRGDWGETKNPQPKGLPEDVGYHAMKGYTILIDDERAKKYEDGSSDLYAVTEEKAKKWENQYHCKIIDLMRWPNDIYVEKRVTNPDYHSASWATRKEIETAFNQVYRKKYNGHYILMGTYSYYQGIISLMKTFEENGDYEVRMVYWFDN